MTRKIVTPRPADIKNVTPAYIRWVQEVSRALNGGIEGADAVTDNVTKTNNIVTGTQKIVIDGIGDPATAFTAQAANINTAAQSAGGTELTASADPAYVFGDVDGAGTTITPANGTAPYAVSLAYKSGSTSITISDAASLTPTFNRPNTTGDLDATWTATVTDDAAGSYPIDIAISLRGKSEGIEN